MPTSSRFGASLLWMTAFAAALLAGCDEAADLPLGRSARDPTPYQEVLALIDAGSRLPAAGDDFTLYLVDPSQIGR